MGAIWDRITSQLIEIIEWLDDTHNTLLWRFPVRAQEIKNGAKLIVREGQSAIFINEGKLADVFGPGTYTLTTQNLPILATLKGWKYGFNSPFKAEVYFVSTTQHPDLKWGTQNPIMLRDPEFGPIRLRAFGIFAIRVKDPVTLLRQAAGTDSKFEVEELIRQLKGNLVSRFTTALGAAKIPALDLASNYDEIGRKVFPILRTDFEEFGVELTKFIIESISLPPQVEKVLDTRSEMSILGNVQQYAAYQAANAIPDAARTPNSMAGAGMGLAAGMALGNQMAHAMFPGQPGLGFSPGYPPPPMAGIGVPVGAPGMPGGALIGMVPAMPNPSAPPPPQAVIGSPGGAPGSSMVERLKRLEGLKAAGVLSEEEYAKKRGEILAEI